MAEINSKHTDIDNCTTAETDDNERREIVGLFPNLDLTEVFAEYGHLSSEAIIGLILDKRQQIPLKQGNGCSFVIDLSGLWPRFLGGTIVRKLLSYVAARVTGVAVDSLLGSEAADRPLSRRPSVKECMDCAVCWETTMVEELCFCDGTTTLRATTSSAIVSNETHAFCRQCLERHALAAIEEMPLARGGLGLRCMVTECENPIILHELQAFLSSSTVQKLEERCAELSVVQANLKYMERCRSCNCAVELGASPDVMQVFRCPECRLEFCRLCDEQWHADHNGISCEVFAKQQNRERLLEKRLTEAVVHNCAKCKMSFVKHDGCNKVTCPCGGTQCYICREHNITYAHFCKCLWGEKVPPKYPFKCAKCGKGCLLWQCAAPVEKQQMDRVRKEMEEEEKREKLKTKRHNAASTLTVAASNAMDKKGSSGKKTTRNGTKTTKN